MANSVSEAIGLAANAAVTALNLPNVTVVNRKTPSYPEGGGDLPQAVVSVGSEPDTEYLTSRQKMRTYPVAVTLVTDNGADTSDDVTTRKWRDQIDAALDQWAPWSGITGFNDVNAGGGPPFDQNALSKDYTYSVQTFRVSVSDPHT